MNHIIIKILLLFCCITVVFSTGVFVSFLKDYVENEQKPTTVVLTCFCMGKDIERSLVIELSKIGVRTSKSSSHMYFKHLTQTSLFVCDLNCPDTAEVLKKAIANNLFRYPYRWLLIKNSSGNFSIEKIPANADSDVVVAETIDDVIVMTELHRPTPNGRFISTAKGFYNGTLFDVRAHREMFKRRKDVMGHPLTMANVIQDSNSTRYHLPREDALELQYDVIPKICWMNAKLAFEMLNATPRYIFSYRWGYKVDGQWSGMINDLHTSRADLGTNCVVSDTERLSVVTYTDMLAPFRVRFVFRQPPLPSVANIFYLPFAGNVWLAMTVCSIVYTVAVFVASKMEFNLDSASASQLDGSVGDAMLLTMSAVSQQGCFMEPKRASGRIMLFVLFTALMALYAAYSANIVVLLQAPSNSIRNLAQLANSKVTLAANDVDYNHFVFSLYKDPIRVMIHKRIDPEKGNGQFYSLHDGVEKIRQGFFAFHSIVEPVYRRIEETFLEIEKCDLTEVDFLSSFDPFVPVKKDSPYLELLRVVFKQIRESGIQSALNKRYQVPKPPCTTKVTAFSSVGLVDIKPVLLLMMYGILLSCAILVIEILAFKMKLQVMFSKCRHTF